VGNKTKFFIANCVYHGYVSRHRCITQYSETFGGLHKNCFCGCLFPRVP